MNDLEKQFEIMEKLVRPDANVREAFQGMTKLMRLFYGYMESKNDSDVSGGRGLYECGWTKPKDATSCTGRGNETGVDRSNDE